MLIYKYTIVYKQIYFNSDTVQAFLLNDKNEIIATKMVSMYSIRRDILEGLPNQKEIAEKTHPIPINNIDFYNKYAILI